MIHRIYRTLHITCLYILAAIALTACTQMQTTPVAVNSHHSVQNLLTQIGFIAIPLEQEASGHLVANVLINNQARLNMIVDSGSGATLITPETAVSLGINTQDTGGTAGGVGGIGVSISSTVVERFQIGALTENQLSLLVIDISHVNQQFEAIGQQAVDGILGSDWMLPRKAIIDIAGQRLFVMPLQSQRYSH